MKFKASEGGIDSKSFLKLKDKEHVVGVFRGDPHDFKQHWGTSKSSLCLGAGCQECKTSRASFRFRINFVTKEPDNTYVAKIWEQGWTVYEALRALHEGGYNLEKTIVKISRSGTDKNSTRYTILPIPNGQILPALEKQLMGMKLLELVNLDDGSDKDASDSSEDAPPPHGDEDMPF